MHVVYMITANLQQTPIDTHALVYGNLTEIVLLDEKYSSYVKIQIHIKPLCQRDHI